MGTWQAPLRKVLRYRDLGGGGLQHHTDGWNGFTWQAGPVQVASYGKWGKVQVYAASEAEGRRVVNHAAGLAGYDLASDPNHRWLIGQHSGGRIGRSGTMAPKPTPDGIAVTMRENSDGRPETAVFG